MRNISPRMGKENRYNQMVNLSIDLQNDINRSVIFPKITARLEGKELKGFINRKKQQQDSMINYLRDEVGRLRRHILHRQNSSYLSNEIQTQDYGSYHRDNSIMIRDIQLLSHHVAKLSQNMRDVEYSSRMDAQRKSDRMMRRQNQHYKKRSDVDSMGMQSVDQLHINSRLNYGSKDKMEKKGSVGKRDQEKQSLKSKRHKSNPKARKRLRSAIIAVYFSIFLQSFARKIYQNKLKAFMALYPYEINKYYNKNDKVSRFKYDESKIWSILEQKMDFMQEVQTNDLGSRLKGIDQVRILKVHFQFLIKEQEDGTTKDIKKQPREEDQLLDPKNVQFLLGKLDQITTKMIDSFVEVLNSTKFVDRFWRTLSQGLLSDSFINNSRPKLLSRVVYSTALKPHPGKQTIMVANKDIEISLLTFDIFCRIFCYRWLVKLHRDKITKKYSQNNTMVCNFLLTIFYLIGQNLIDEKVKVDIKTGFNIGDRFKVNNRRIRPIIPLSVKKKYKGIDTQTKRLIADPPLLDEASTVVLQNQEIVDKIKTKMLKAGTELYKRLKILMKEDHKVIKEASFHQKLIIHGDKKRNQNLNKYQPQQPGKHKESSISINYSQGEYSQSKILTQLSKPKGSPGKVKMMPRKFRSKHSP